MKSVETAKAPSDETKGMVGMINTRSIPLAEFSLRDMIRCGAEIRQLGEESASEESFCESLVRYLQRILTNGSGDSAFILARFFRTIDFAGLDEQLQSIVRGSIPEPTPQMKCLRLLATVGNQPQWNAVERSAGHRVIPLPSPEVVERMPMIAQLVRQLGFDLHGLLAAQGSVMIDRPRTGVFHVPQALGSPFIPAQQEFVIPFGVQSVIGFGDLLPDGNLFAVVLFSEVPVAGESAALFSHLSLSTKVALLRNMSGIASDPLVRIRNLEDLIRNYEEVVLEQDESIRVENADRREAEEFFGAAVKASPHGMVMIDGDGRIKLANPELGRLFGFDPPELVGQPIETLVPAAMRDEHVRLRNRFLQNPQVRPMAGDRTLFGQRRDGSQFPVEIGLNPVRTAQGLFVLASVIDISERVRAENRMRRIVEAAPTGMIMVDQSGTIQLVNSKTEEIFKFTRDDLIGQPVEILIPTRFRDRHPRLRDDFFKNSTARPMGEGRDLFGLRSDGSEFPVELGLNPIETEQGTFVLASVIDITTRKREADELAKAKDAAETANRAKSEFLANMSHEIRTPMNAVIGMTELALDTKLSAEQREYLETVRDSAGALLVVINDILDFSKIEAGKLELDLQPFHLSDSLSNTLKTLTHRAFEKKTELIFEADAHISNHLIGDAGRLRQIIMNLVGNAIKFTEAGEVILRVSKDMEDENEVTLHFSISDTGIGIPEEKQSKIFDSFSQADSSTTRKFGGTGLGLTISKHLVELMDGRIWVESKEGQGSTFHFTLRLPRDSDVSRSPPVRDLLRLKDLRVLIVDDNQTNGQILRRVLRNWNMRPVVASSAREALTAIENANTLGTSFQLVLTDCHMPDMDGFDLSEQIRQRADASALSIIMLTSGVLPGSSQRCQELGVAALMLKPANPSELLEAIQRTFIERRAKQPKGPEEPAKIVAPSLSPLRVLLAEDNLVNQKLSVRLLQKIGHTTVVAGNGQEAIEKFASEAFDLILMDVQMPDMDGFDATAAIREIERQNGGHTPIIALTAHAMQGDRERCLAAGMDDYVSKPINPTELGAAIQRVMAHPHAAATEDAPGESSTPPEETSIFDEQAALDRIDGDVEFLRELMQDFLAQSDAMITEMRLSAEKRDAASLRRIAHTLKSMAGSFCAAAASDAALRLELISAEEKLDESEAALAQLEMQLERLQKAFRQRLA